MAALGPVGSAAQTYDQLKSLVSIARERSARVACSAWSKDAEICKMLEDWTRDSEKRDLTKMPGLFVAFESAILGGMQKILYISEAMAKSGSVDVVTQPPAKLLQMVRAQFVSSVYKALSGLVENAERLALSEGDNEWVISRPLIASQAVDAALSVLTADSVDSRNRVSVTAPCYVIIVFSSLTSAECTDSSYTFESQGPSGRICAAADCQLRDFILGQVDGRGRDRSGCLEANRRPTLPVIHQADYCHLE